MAGWAGLAAAGRGVPPITGGKPGLRRRVMGRRRCAGAGRGCERAGERRAGGRPADPRQRQPPRPARSRAGHGVGVERQGATFFWQLLAGSGGAGGGAGGRDEHARAQAAQRRSVRGRGRAMWSSFLFGGEWWVPRGVEERGRQRWRGQRQGCAGQGCGAEPRSRTDTAAGLTLTAPRGSGPQLMPGKRKMELQRIVELQLLHCALLAGLSVPFLRASVKTLSPPTKTRASSTAASTETGWLLQSAKDTKHEKSIVESSSTTSDSR